MSDEEPAKVIRSDAQQLVDLVTALIGLGLVLYTQNPEPFERAWEHVRSWGYAWMHRISVWEARQAIRSLPETDESS